MPLSNLVSEENRCCAQPAQLKKPRRCSSLSGLLYGASVPALRSTLYWVGVSRFCHSASVWVTTNWPSGDAHATPSAQAVIATVDSAAIRNRRRVTSMA
ncbi:Uncharacterised protein [Mycobacterium tuberculosis]|nr:Uncharacterised protein [Mycobacterium tuberculosis]